MLKNDKTPAATGACHGVNSAFIEKNTTIDMQTQRLQKGWLLIDLLRDHVVALRFFNSNFDGRITQNLIENGWLEGGGHES